MVASHSGRHHRCAACLSRIRVRLPRHNGIHDLVADIRHRSIRANVEVHDLGLDSRSGSGALGDHGNSGAAVLPHTCRSSTA